MSNELEKDRELLDLLVEGDDKAADTREEWSAVLANLRGAHEPADLPLDFNSSLRRRREAEATHPVARNWSRIVLPLAAAAVLAAVLLWPGGSVIRRGNQSVAWADVVTAMQRVKNFHLIVFRDDPRRSDEKMRMSRMDLFYQEPDFWRAQGMGYVAFASATRSTETWSVEKHRVLQPGSDDRVPQLLPADFRERHMKQGTLAAVLAWFFNGKVPPGEPIKSDEVASAEGIDVFDYARNPSERWVRIWVLRASQLPLRMHMYFPGSDEFILLTFDYSDPQPAVFFDARYFVREASKMQGSDPYRAYSIGSRPVAGTRPRGADQIHAVEGGYRAPQVKRVASNEAGDVLVVTDHPSNTTPDGSRPHQQGYRTITDNWGNTLIPAGGEWGYGEQAERLWPLMPLPPFKKGNTPRKITMTFVIEPRYGQRQDLKTETLDVLDPAASGATALWSRMLDQQKRSAYRTYLRTNATLEKQLEEIARSLNAEAGDIDALVWKFKLLREHGREEAAWSMFEGDLRARVFADAKSLNDHYVEASQYLLHLAAAGRTDELHQRSAAVEKSTREAQANADPRTELSMLRRKDDNPLIAASHLLEWREAFKDQPQIVRTLASRDGFVFVELSIPKPPEGWRSNGWDGSAPYGWFWQSRSPDEWRQQARLVKLEERRLWQVFRVKGDRLSLEGEVLLALDNYGSVAKRNDAKLPWRRAIPVPPATIDGMKEWWLKETGGKADSWWPDQPASAPAAPPAPAHDWNNQAAKLRDAGQFAEALELYTKALVAPADQWPSWYTDKYNPDLLEMVKRQIRVSQAQCLAELGRFDEARKIVDEIRAALPAQIDLMNHQQSQTAADAVRAELNIPRVMFKRGELAGAAAEMKRTGARRPSLADVTSGTIMEERPWGRSGWLPRAVQEEVWRAYDALWWDLHDAGAL